MKLFRCALLLTLKLPRHTESRDMPIAVNVICDAMSQIISLPPPPHPKLVCQLGRATSHYRDDERTIWGNCRTMTGRGNTKKLREKAAPLSFR
jgi:hypothetical protein